MKCLSKVNNLRFIKKNVEFGMKFEKPWRKILKKKYPSIIDNNIEDRFCHMDALSSDNGELIEHEHRSRDVYHNQYRGLMLNKCKIDYSIKQLKKNIRQIYYLSCKDGLYFWELKDPEKQKDEMIYYRNGNLKNKCGLRDVVDIKKKYLTKYEFL